MTNKLQILVRACCIVFLVTASAPLCGASSDSSTAKMAFDFAMAKENIWWFLSADKIVALQQLIQKNPDVLKKTDKILGDTALHSMADRYEHEDDGVVLDVLLKQPTLPNLLEIPNKAGKTPLWKAIAAYGDIGILAGVRPQEAPLWKRRQESTITKLLSAGADPIAITIFVDEEARTDKERAAFRPFLKKHHADVKERVIVHVPVSPLASIIASYVVDVRS